MRIVKNILLWFISIFLLLLSIIFLPSFSSALLLLAALLAAPIKATQTKINLFLSKKLKIAIVLILTLISLAALPESSPEETPPTLPNDVQSENDDNHQDVVVQDEDTVQSIKYHDDERINRLLIAYNEISDYPITPEMVQEGAYDDWAYVSYNGVWVTITASDINGMFVDYEDEASNDEAIKLLFNDFSMAMNPELTSDEIGEAWTALQSGKYHGYSDTYDMSGIVCTYFTQSLNNGETRYIVKTNCKTYQ